MMNFLFFGLGGIGQRHLRIIKKLRKTSKIFAFRKSKYQFEINDNLEINKKVNIIDKYSIHIINSENILKKYKFNLAIISNPTNLHLDTCIKMAKLKIPFLVEKPFSHNNQNFLKLLKLINTNKIKFYVGYMMRFHPQTKILYKLINSKKIGKIYNVTLNINSHMPSWHKYENYKKLYANNTNMGGGVIPTECHELDLMNYLFSSPIIKFKFSNQISDYEVKADDNSLLILEYKYMNKSFLSTIQSSFVQKKSFRKLIIFSNNYFIKWDINNANLEIINFKNNMIKKNKILNFNRNKMFESQMKYILNDLKKSHFKSIFHDLDILTHKTLVSIINKKNG